MPIFRRVFLLHCGAFFLLCFAMPATAQTIDWTGNGDGTTYQSAANWDGVNIPDIIGETAHFNVAPTFDVIFGSGSVTTVSDLLVNDGVVTFASNGATAATYTIDDDALITGGDLTLSESAGTGDLNMNVGDQIRVEEGSTFTVLLGADVTAADLELGISGVAGDGTMIIDGAGSTFTQTGTPAVRMGQGGNAGTLTFQNSSTGNTILGQIHLIASSGAANTAGRLNVLSGSSLQAASIVVGNSGSASVVQEATLTVDGPSSLLTQTGAATLTIGDDMNPNIVADLIVSGGGQFDTGTGPILIQNSGTLSINDGTFNANGALTMTAGSALTLDGGALGAAAGLDNSAGGTLNFLDGTLTVTGGAFVPNAGGSYTIQGPSAAELPHLQIGAGATSNIGGGLFVGLTRRGELTVAGGGSVSTTSAVIGDSAGSTGTATIDGAGSDWTNSGSLFVGDGGDGTLNIQNGGAVSSDEGLIGILSGSTSTATVDGTGSNWTNSLGLFVGGGGDGTLSIQNGAAVSNIDGFIGNVPGSTGTATVSGTDGLATPSTWDNSADLTVGNQGTGALSVDGGGLVTSMFDAFIGISTGSSGNVEVMGTDGAGTPSTWLTTTLTVGIDGTGDLAITGGGQVTAFGLSEFGQSTGTGAVTVSGSDGLGLSSNLTTGPLTIGSAGTGTLNIANGAEGLVLGGSTSLGALTSGVGTATIDGAGSTWTNSSNLTVGLSGAGTLNIQNGGEVTSSNGFVGFNSSSTSAATVDGAGSTWTNTGVLLVAESGNGTLNIQNGGMVSNTFDGSIAVKPGSIGTVTVDGAGSTWMNSANLFVGGNNLAAGGTGNLVVQDQGLAEVADTLKIWGPGTATINGGTIALDALDVEPGGSMAFNFGTLNFKSNLTVAPGDSLQTALGGSHTVAFGRLLQVDGTTTLNNILTVGGGTFSTADIVNPQLLQFNTGTLGITGAGGLTVGAAGPFGSSLSIGVGQNLDVTNTLTVDAGATLSLATGGNILAGAVSNSGQLQGSGTLAGPLTNNVGGEIQGLAGANLVLTGSGNTNNGQVTLSGGQIHFTQDFNNSATGLVIGNGTLRADGGTTNDGDLAFSATANVIGDVTNNATGTIISAGGTTTFFDDVINNGEIRTNENSFSVYFGSYGGNGDTGTGTVIMEGDLKPGFSPAEVNFGGDLTLTSTATLEMELAGTAPGSGHDKINVAGTATLDGNLDVLLIDGFENSIAQVDQFTILDATSLTGTFANIAPGGRLAIEEFGGEIQVDYGATSPFDPTQVVLSDFVFVPIVATWVAGASQWTTATNWDIGAVPDNGPPIYDAIVPTGTATVDAPIAVRALSVPPGGTLDVDNDLTVTEDATFTGGSVDVGAGTTLQVGGAVTFEPGTYTGGGEISPLGAVVTFDNGLTNIQVSTYSLDDAAETIIAGSSNMILNVDQIDDDNKIDGTITINRSSSLHISQTSIFFWEASALSTINFENAAPASSLNQLTGQRAVLQGTLNVNGGLARLRAPITLRADPDFVPGMGVERATVNMNPQGILRFDNLADIEDALITGGGTIRFLKDVNGTANIASNVDIDVDAFEIANDYIVNVNGSNIRASSLLVDVGSITLDGAATFEVSDVGTAGGAGFYVGLPGGTGDVAIDGGGTLTTVDATVGNAGGGTGTVQILDAASQWTIGGTLSIQDGGNVQITDGTLSSSNAIQVTGGQLSGTGTVAADINNTGGTVSPGLSPGVLTMTGLYTQGASGTLEIEIGGTTAGSQFDQVNVTGAATLDGTLDVALIDAFFPTPGETFEVMTFASHSGEFASVTGDVGLLDPVTFLLPLYNDTNLMLFTAIAGDGNLSGAVEAGDYTIWANEFGAGDEFTEGDYNGDGVVGPADYTLWANNFGLMVSAPSSAAAGGSPSTVPEPSALFLLAIGLSGVAATVRRPRPRHR